VAVDLPKDSPTLAQWVGVKLSEDNKSQLWVPPGFAHGYYVTSEQAVFGYKCTDMYHPETQFSVRWNDPAIGIDWPLNSKPVLADKDRDAPLLAEIDESKLPVANNDEN
jgi:dTDP-4-dehydrorhamnose 3,5-epimerase